MHKPPFLISRTVDKLESEILLRKFLSFHFDFSPNLTQKLTRLSKISIQRDGKLLKRREIHERFPLLAGDVVCVRDCKAIIKDVQTGQPAFIGSCRSSLPSAAARRCTEESSRINTGGRGTGVDLSDLELSLRKSIVYMDADLLVLNKPSNVAVHGGTGQGSAYTVNRILDALCFGYKEQPRIVHRLDMATSGLLLLARNHYSATRLSEMFRRTSQLGKDEHQTPSIDAFGNFIEKLPGRFQLEEITDSCSSGMTVEKTYWAILTQTPEQRQGTIDRHIYLPPETASALTDRQILSLDSEDMTHQELPLSTKITLRSPDKISPFHRENYLKRAITNYEVIEDIGGVGGGKGCWIRLQPITGRKHQLRVHCSHPLGLGASILGDRRYGIKSYRRLSELGWGQIFDFSKWSGVNMNNSGGGGGLPLFLHLRQLRIKNYFENLGGGASSVVSLDDRKRISNGMLENNGDLVLTASLPPIWKELLRSCNLDSSRKF